MLAWLSAPIDLPVSGMIDERTKQACRESSSYRKASGENRLAPPETAQHWHLTLQIFAFTIKQTELLFN